MDVLDYIEKGRGYIEQHPEVLAGVFAVLFVLNVVTFFVAGWRAEQKFRGQGHQPIRFRERGASGYSNRSTLTRLGWANRALEVVVTDAEVWIKGIWPPVSYIGSRFDMTHRIQRLQIRSAQARNDAGSESHIVLRLEAPQAFMSALGV
jgi:hypothetical protein